MRTSNVISGICMAALFCACCPVASAQTDQALQTKIEDLGKKVEALQGQVNGLTEKNASQERLLGEADEDMGAILIVILFLYGIVFSLWAMSRGRSGLLWFIAGIIPCWNMLAGLCALSWERQYRRSLKVNDH